ncbi:MAG: 4a-hydroxytetrahydrobiopterin dehydratase [Chlorobiaceae bacterium]|nr:4a-hydroxytetrahydrobiopterin dehydratase [Chlorobiales bacterium]NTU90853.1 4a-hydroxytetrahydrobiopterin dehydratase [Chlorobiaceae bacterium]NTV25993.1 4a-hydroxytetrahydrobiopterin dehydratase [Chlorobiaceae bacterium]
MTDLDAKHCVPCSGTATPMAEEEFRTHQSYIPDWNVVEENGVKHLVKVFKFNDFIEAMEFTDKVGKLAEAEGHHPVIMTEWGKVTVSWWTHAINGLHLNDVIMAAKTDRL